MRRAWFVMLALVGCRQVFGIDEPLPTGGGGNSTDAQRFTDGHAIFFDSGPTMSGLAMYVEDGATLWTNDQSPDAAWQQTNNALGKPDTWGGADLTVGELAFDGVIDGQHPFSLWMEGEILVSQQTEQIQIVAADYAFFDVATFPGAYQRVVSSRNGMMQSKSFNVALPGWYSVRIGWATTPATAELHIVQGGGNGPQLSLFDATTLRH